LFNENSWDIEMRNSEVLNNILNQYEDRIDYAHYLHIGIGERYWSQFVAGRITQRMWKNKSDHI
jgi:hypothetical protein